jgi:RNAse (barnase) inhibitor barstar
MGKPIIKIDGRRFDNLQGFYDEVERTMIRGAQWGRNLDAFNDILRGGFGTPEGGFVLRWTHSMRSRQMLGHEETARYLESVLERCHPSNRTRVADKLEAARQGRGDTLFDMLIGIIHVHCAGGSEAEDGVELQLTP